MPKLPTSAALAALLGVGVGCAPAAAAILGPHAAACGAGQQGMLVRIVGLKARSGTLRIQSYGGNPATFLDKGTYIERVEIAPPASGPIELCLPVARPGVYAVSVRHQVNGSSSSDMSDGGGLSGNPQRSVFDMALRRKPAPEQISVRVNGVVTVPIVMNYLQGGSFKPVTVGER